MGFISIIKYLPAKKCIQFSNISIHKKVNKQLYFNQWHHENRDLL